MNMKMVVMEHSHKINMYESILTEVTDKRVRRNSLPSSRILTNKY